MSREFTPQLRLVAGELIREAGPTLASVIRERGITCEVCGAPIDRAGVRCIPCGRHAQSMLPLADRVGSMIYAVEGETQAYKIVHDYKAVRPGPSLQRHMRALLGLGLWGHARCAAVLSGENRHGWVVVPSTQARTTLRTLVLSTGWPLSDEVAVEFVGVNRVRDLRPQDWRVLDSATLPEHILVVDDSWVTGANAQSVASMLKASGVNQVSVFTVARVLRADFNPNPDFIRRRLRPPVFDWTRCPWTGADCPEP